MTRVPNFPKLSADGEVFAIQRSSERAHFDHGWLQTAHSFSFADYHDPRNLNWGALRVLNDDRVAGGAGFPTHPHRDMDILTYVLQGKLEHRDSTGSHGIVGPGGVQYMSAGSGVRHSEFNNSPTEELRFLQMWVLPRSTGGGASYGQVEFDVADRTDRWLDVADGRPGATAPITLSQDAAFRVARLATKSVDHRFAPDRLGFLFVAEGAITVTGSSNPPDRNHTAVLQTGDALRIREIHTLTIEGVGEIVLWDVPAV